MTRRRGSAGGWALLLVALGCGTDPYRLARRPNILLISVDTLRADHLPFYGYPRDTAPQLAARMAAGGVTFESAYAPSAWTVPSMATLLTGKDPSALVHVTDLRAFEVPRDEATLAERLHETGYQTAGFVGNFLLHGGAGFRQGFVTYRLVQGGLDSVTMPAERVLDPALEWLAARPRKHEPFFLFAHFMDPHDPYTSPELVDGRSEYYPDYAGPLRGEDVHEISVGATPLSDDPEADLRHLEALYDSEIRHVDRAAGRLIDAVETASTRPTLVIFVADHGEEFLDHGGWTHSRTVYEEIVRVPMLIRLTGVVAGGRRVPELVGLEDVVPTVLAAAGVEHEPMAGKNLLPVLLDPDRPPARRTVFVRHWNRGPIRAALLVGGTKTMIFNHRQPFSPEPGIEEFLHAEDLRRLPRFAAFDLERDPGESSPREPTAAEIEAVYRELDPTLDGLRVLLRGLEPGVTATGELGFRRPPAGTLPLFLADEDLVELSGRRLTFRLTGETAPKGFLVLGDFGALESAAALRVDGSGEAALEIATGAGLRWSGRPLAAVQLDSARWPAWSGRPGLSLWTRASRALVADRPLDAETRARLRALGYL